MLTGCTWAGHAFDFRKQISHNGVVVSEEPSFNPDLLKAEPTRVLRSLPDSKVVTCVHVLPRVYRSRQCRIFYV